MKKKTVIRTERHEVWVIRPSGSNSPEDSSDFAETKDDGTTNTDETTPEKTQLIDEGDEKGRLLP